MLNWADTKGLSFRLISTIINLMFLCFSVKDLCNNDIMNNIRHR